MCEALLKLNVRQLTTDKGLTAVRQKLLLNQEVFAGPTAAHRQHMKGQH